MQLNRIPFVRIVLFVLLGICTGPYIDFPFRFYTSLLLASVFVFISILIYSTKYRPFFIHNNGTFFGLLAAVCWFLAGLSLSHYHDPRHASDFIGKIPARAYLGTIYEQPTPSAKATRCKLKVYQIIDQNNQIAKACGNIELRLEPDSSQVPLKYGQQIMVAANIEPAITPVNPRQFDYGEYLSRKYIFHTQWVKKGQWKIINAEPGFSIKGYSIQTAALFEQILHKYIPFKRESGIAAALILGAKEQVDEQIQQAYSGAGALHILAVSGMHIALFFQMLLLIFGRIKKIKYGNLLFFVLVILVIWFYAFITGLSASVLRAAVMFSFVLVAQLIDRRLNPYNILAASALMMMIFNPNIIFDIGFQLSYLAVVGIFALGKPITNLYIAKNKIMHYIWEATAITLAAQAFTFPLCLYYFNQFPNLFLFTNLPLIFFSTIALYAGLFLLLCAPFYWLAFCVGYVVFAMVWLMNQIVLLAAKIPFALSEGMYLSVWELCWLYIGTIAITLFFLAKKLSWLKVAIVSFVFVGLSTFIAEIARQNSRIWGIYSLPRQSMIWQNASAGLTHALCPDSTFNNTTLLRQSIWPHGFMIGANSITKASITLLNKWPAGYGFSIWGKKVLVHNSSMPKGYILKKPIQTDILIIQNQTLNIYKNQKISFLGNCKIIIDKTNSKNYAIKLEKRLIEQGHQVHNVWNLGPYIEDYSIQWVKNMRAFY